MAAGGLPSGIGSLTVKLPAPSPAVAGALRQAPAVAAGAASPPSVSTRVGVSDDGSERSAGSRGVGAVVVAGAPSGSMAGPGIGALIAVVEGVPPPVTLDVERRLKVGSASLALCEALKQRNA